MIFANVNNGAIADFHTPNKYSQGKPLSLRLNLRLEKPGILEQYVLIILAGCSNPAPYSHLYSKPSDTISHFFYSSFSTITTHPLAQTVS